MQYFGSPLSKKCNRSAIGYHCEILMFAKWYVIVIHIQAPAYLSVCTGLPHPFGSALCSIQRPVQPVPGCLPLVKRPGRGIYHPSTHLAPRLKNGWSYASTPLWAFMVCSRVNFAFFYGWSNKYIHTYKHTDFSVRIQVRWIFKNIDVDWIHMAQNSVHWWACINTVKCQGLKSVGNFLINTETAGFSRKIWHDRSYRLHELAVCGMIVAW